MIIRKRLLAGVFAVGILGMGSASGALAPHEREAVPAAKLSLILDVRGNRPCVPPEFGVAFMPCALGATGRSAKPVPVRTPVPALLRLLRVL